VGLFEGVGHGRFKFCLLTIAGGSLPGTSSPDFFFFAHETSDLADPHRHFTLTAEDIALINPNTRTCPIFRTQRDAEITKAIYRRVPVLVKEGPPEENPWGIRFMRMFDMSNDSHLFRTREQFEGDGFALRGNRFVKDEEEYVPLYEAKMMHQYTHRFGDYAMKPAGSQDTELPRIPPERLADPDYVVLPRYWVRRKDLPDLGGRQWLLGFRDITNATNERTAIFAVLPPVGVGHTMPLLFAETKPALLLSVLDSLPCDWVLRQSLGGTHLTFFIVKQLAILPASYTPAHLAFLTPRVLELTYTAWDLAGFGRDLGYDGPPFRWDEERRFLLRSELDALYFHLYGIARNDVDYILDTFPIVRRKDEAAYGEYRTKRVILEIYDALAEAERTRVPYQSRLDPPPADPSCRHPKKKAGILAFGSLIGDPGCELAPRIEMRIKTQTPFPVEYGRLSRTRGGAPTLVPHPKGAPVSAEMLVLEDGVSIDEARDMLWRRERRKECSKERYAESQSENAVLVREFHDSAWVETALYTDFHESGKIAEPSPAELASAAIASVGKAEAGKDGISYLIHAIACGIQTPLTGAYKEEILRQTGATSLEAALDRLRKQP
jgi:hypothetical protein